MTKLGLSRSNVMPTGQSLVETETLRALTEKQVGKASPAPGWAEDDRGLSPRKKSGTRSSLLTLFFSVWLLIWSWVLPFPWRVFPILGHKWIHFHVPGDSPCQRELSSLFKCVWFARGVSLKDGSTGPRAPPPINHSDQWVRADLPVAGTMSHHSDWFLARAAPSAPGEGRGQTEPLFPGHPNVQAL